MKASSRIAILTPYASSDYVGGIEIFNGQLERALGRAEVFAHSERSPNSAWNLARLGMEQPYGALRAARSLRKRHISESFRLIISNGLSGWPLSFWNLGIPQIQVYHYTPAAFARQALLHRGDRMTTRTVSAFFDRLAGRGKRVIAVSPSVLREVEHYYGLRGEVIPNAVDTALFRRMESSEARETLGIPQGGTVGLFVGRAQYAKGFDILLKVAETLQDIRFIVAGRCPNFKANVEALGEVPRSQMPLCYSSADFLLLPSRYEGFNLSILEALSCDLPIVVSQAAYPFGVDPSRYGCVVGSQNPEDFVRAIREVLDRGSPIASRKDILAGYSFEVFQRNWQNLVNTVLDGSDARTEEP